MKWPQNMQDKIKAITVLIIIIIVILLNNLSDRRTFSDLDKSITSIYQDRLMPATYIFQLTRLLYETRLHHEHNPGTAGIGNHKDTIESLIRNYEATYLTRAEKEQWGMFKNNLGDYYTRLNKYPASNNAETAFDKALGCLKVLSNIQAKEGAHLKQSSSNMVSGTYIMSQLEISLLLILCILAGVLVGTTDLRDKKIPGPSLN